VTSGFGTGRTFNGEVTSRHLGVDFRGATGSPIAPPTAASSCSSTPSSSAGAWSTSITAAA
jgi:hypothetical protein